VENAEEENESRARYGYFRLNPRFPPAEKNKTKKKIVRQKGVSWGASSGEICTTSRSYNLSRHTPRHPQKKKKKKHHTPKKTGKKKKPPCPPTKQKTTKKKKVLLDCKIASADSGTRIQRTERFKESEGCTRVFLG